MSCGKLWGAWPIVLECPCAVPARWHVCSAHTIAPGRFIGQGQRPCFRQGHKGGAAQPAQGRRRCGQGRRGGAVGARARKAFGRKRPG
eukprot:357023-Chlamydomonas_euryale.AAC.7